MQGAMRLAVLVLGLAASALAAPGAPDDADQLPMEARDSELILDEDGPPPLTAALLGPPVLNGGKPFFADKDPVTGKLDLSAAKAEPAEPPPQDPAIDYDYEEHDGIDRKDTVGTRGRPNDLHSQGALKIVTPNFHDFLNLPVKYSSAGDKYPLISSSYANTKVQGMGASSANSANSASSGSIKNHKPYSPPSTQPAPHYYSLPSTSSTSTTTTTTQIPTTSTTTTTTTTTTTPPPPTTRRTTTTTTTMRPTTRPKPTTASSFWSLLGGDDYSEQPSEPSGPSGPSGPAEPVAPPHSSFGMKPPARPTSSEERPSVDYGVDYSYEDEDSVPALAARPQQNSHQPPALGMLPADAPAAPVPSSSPKTPTTSTATTTTTTTTTAPATPTTSTTTTTTTTTAAPAPTTLRPNTRRPQLSTVMIMKPFNRKPVVVTASPAEPSTTTTTTTAPTSPSPAVSTTLSTTPAATAATSAATTQSSTVATPTPTTANVMLVPERVGAPSNKVVFEAAPRPPAAPVGSAGPRPPPNRPPYGAVPRPQLPPRDSPYGVGANQPFRPLYDRRPGPPSPPFQQPPPSGPGMLPPSGYGDLITDAGPDNNYVSFSFLPPSPQQMHRPPGAPGAPLPPRFPGVEPPRPQPAGPFKPPPASPSPPAPTPAARPQPPTTAPETEDAISTSDKQQPTQQQPGDQPQQQHPHPHHHHNHHQQQHKQSQPQQQQPPQPPQQQPTKPPPPASSTSRVVFPDEKRDTDQPSQQDTKEIVVHGSFQHPSQLGPPRGPSSAAQGQVMDAPPPFRRPATEMVPPFDSDREESEQQPAYELPPQAPAPATDLMPPADPGKIRGPHPAGPTADWGRPHSAAPGRPKPGHPQGHTQGHSQGHPQGIPQGFPQGSEQGVRQGHPQGMEQGVRQGHPQGMEQGVRPQGMEQGVRQGHPQGMEQGVRQGHPQGMEQGVRQGHPQGMEQGVRQGHPQGMEHGVRQGHPQGMEHGIRQGHPQGMDQGVRQGHPSGLGQGLGHGMEQGFRGHPPGLAHPQSLAQGHPQGHPQGLRPKLDTLPLGPRNPGPGYKMKPDAALPNILPQFRPNARLSGPQGPLGALGPLGPLGPLGAHPAMPQPLMQQRMPLMERPGDGRPHSVLPAGPSGQPLIRVNRHNDDADGRPQPHRRSGPPMEPPPPPRRRVATLQMMQQRGASPSPAHRVLSRAELPGMPGMPGPGPAPVFLVYPVEQNKQRLDDEVLAPNAIKLDKLDDLMLDGLARGDDPVLKPARQQLSAGPGKPFRPDFPYAIEQPSRDDLSGLAANGVRSPPAAVSADKRRDDLLDDRDNGEVNVIPYLQDYLPFATKRPPAAAVAAPAKATLLPVLPARIVLGSGNSAPPATALQQPISATLKTVVTPSPVGPPSRHETVIGGASGGSEFTVGAVMHTLSNHRQTSAEDPALATGPVSPSGLPQLDDQGFQAPFQASVSVESALGPAVAGVPGTAAVAPGVEGWSVLSGGMRPGTVDKADIRDIIKESSSTEASFDFENFKPQLFGGFKPILPSEEEAAVAAAAAALPPAATTATASTDRQERQERGVSAA